jgi:hypothetical protein
MQRTITNIEQQGAHQIAMDAAIIADQVARAGI